MADEHEPERRRKGPASVGLLPEDPDDPPKPSLRELLWTGVLVVLVVGVHIAIPDDWSFWQQAGAYVCAALALGLATRTWAIWYPRRTAADPPSTDKH